MPEHPKKTKSFKNRVVVTVDGLAGSGKSTLSSLFARRIGFIHFNSGNPLHPRTWFARLDASIDIAKENSVISVLKDNNLSLELDNKDLQVVKTAHGKIFDIPSLQQPAISEVTSKISTFKEVRALLIPLQREAFNGNNLVAEGRDMEQ